ncbi:MAG: integrase, partial [Deltaproteobacteria bacterium]
NQISVDDVLAVLNPLWHSKNETASRLRMRLEKILDWARVRGYRRGPNPAVWRGNLDTQLTARNKIQKVVHLKSLAYAQVPAFLVDLQKQTGTSARALHLGILTAARPGEIRGAVWDEFDLETGVWTVPAERMKGRKEHRVPLSPQALELIKSLPVIDGSPLLFPAPRGGKKLSDMAMTALLKRMGVESTAHGFRTSLRTWAAEETEHLPIVAEMALAHAQESKVVAAYQRGDLFKKRTALLTAWATYLDQVPDPED